MGARHSVGRRVQGGEEVGMGKRVTRQCDQHTALLRANTHTSHTAKR